MSPNSPSTAKHTVFAPAHLSPAEGERIAVLMEQVAAARSARRRRQRRAALLSGLIAILIVISLFAVTKMLRETADTATGDEQNRAVPTLSTQNP